MGENYSQVSSFFCLFSFGIIHDITGHQVMFRGPSRFSFSHGLLLLMMLLLLLVGHVVVPDRVAGCATSSQNFLGRWAVGPGTRLWRVGKSQPRGINDTVTPHQRNGHLI